MVQVDTASSVLNDVAALRKAIDAADTPRCSWSIALHVWHVTALRWTLGV